MLEMSIFVLHRFETSNKYWFNYWCDFSKGRREYTFSNCIFDKDVRKSKAMKMCYKLVSGLQVPDRNLSESSLGYQLALK